MTGEGWQSLMDLAELAVNTRLAPNQERTPYELAMAREPRLSLDVNLEGSWVEQDTETTERLDSWARIRNLAARHQISHLPSHHEPPTVAVPPLRTPRPHDMPRDDSHRLPTTNTTRRASRATETPQRPSARASSTPGRPYARTRLQSRRSQASLLYRSRRRRRARALRRSVVDPAARRRVACRAFLGYLARERAREIRPAEELVTRRSPEFEHTFLLSLLSRMDSLDT